MIKISQRDTNIYFIEKKRSYVGKVTIVTGENRNCF